MKKWFRKTGLQTMFAAAAFGVVLTAISCQASLSDAAGTDGQTARSLALPSHSASVDNIEEWALIDFGSNDDMQSVAFGGGVFVAGAGRDAWTGKLVRSADNGVSWTAAASNGGLENINAITYGNGIFVAVGDSAHSPYNKIAYSIDGGINWVGTSASDLGINDGDYFRSVAFGEDTSGNGVFVAGGGVDYPAVQNVLYTSDPTSSKPWQHSPTAEALFSKVDCQAITYAVAENIGTWVALGGNGGLTAVIASGYSVDGGQTWLDAEAVLFCKGVAFDGTYYIGTGQFGRITLSTTGRPTWTNVQMNGWADDYANFINCVAVGNGISVVVGEGKLAYTTLSPISANNWTFLSNAEGQLPVGRYQNAIAFGNNTFVTVGDGGYGMRAAATVVPSYTVSGTVTDGGIPVSGAEVTIDAPLVAAVTTGSNGDYIFTGVRNGTYTVTATNGTDSGTATVMVNGAAVTGVDIELSPPLPPLPNMVSLAGGSFSMGSTRDTDSSPVHTVTLTPFYMNKYEVSQAEFSALMGFNPSTSSVGADYPVETVTWYDAAAYCNELSLQQNRSPAYTITDVVKTGNSITSATVVWNTEYTGYRLPTEAEWEYACRGGTTTTFFWGNSAAQVGTYTWYSVNTDTTQPIGTKVANPFALYDMTGNVWEWCWDWYSATYYSSSPAQDPKGPDTGATRVQRGGCWISIQTYNFESARRDTHEPGELEVTDPEAPSSTLGFRVVLPNPTNK